MSKTANKFSNPSRILSKNNLVDTWYSSRDSKSKPGSAGCDKISAHSFGANLGRQVEVIHGEISRGAFSFSHLKPEPIPKENSEQFRLVCIPTIRDRLVQRCICEYIHSRKMYRIFHSSSYGFVPDQGVKKAIRDALTYRENYDYVFETDILSFFDKLSRQKLEEKIYQARCGKSLIPLLVKASKCEVKFTKKFSKQKFAEMGMKKGVGVRQGMPLSPVFANIYLSDFDRNIERSGFRMIRYADDIVIFCSSESDLTHAHDIVVEELNNIGLQIPDLGISSKTRYVRKFEPLSFLGRELVFSERDGRFIQRVSKQKIKKLLLDLTKDFQVEKFISENKAFADLTEGLAKRVASYMNSYRDAHNLPIFEKELKLTARKVTEEAYTNIFGKKSVRNLSDEHKRFLGLDAFEFSQLAVDDFY